MSEQTPRRFALSGQVLHDSIDGEVIVIDLGTGTYYSLRGSAAEIWTLVEQHPGLSAAELARALGARYENGGNEIEAGVTQFLHALREEGLLHGLNGNAPTTALPAVDESHESPGGSFVVPTFEKHTDMQDLVLIDPVHDVSDAGWPHVRPDPDSDSGA